MAMVNMNNLLNMKDSRWLQLEVCREFQRNKCSRPDTECKFAHPPVNVEVQNGRVTACYDSIKGRCNREKPPCKYFHPPLHLKDQLLINGRNHLALKNALMQQMGMGPGQGVVPGQVPTVATNPYLGVTNSYNPYFPTGPLVSLVSDPTGAQVMSPLGVPQQAVIQQKNYQTAREIWLRRQPRGSPGQWDCRRSPGQWTMTHTQGNQVHIAWFSCPRLERLSSPGPPSPDSSSHPWTSSSPGHISPNYPGMVTYKRPADKGGVPVYPQGNSASAAAYQHLMQLQQQPFVPVSSSSIQHHLQQTSAHQSPVHVTTSTSSPGETNGPITNEGGAELLETPQVKKMKSEGEDGGGSNGGDESGGGGNGLGGDAEEESKDESNIANVKRMRVNAGGTPPAQVNNPIMNNSGTGSNAATAAVLVQNNAAYAAAAQNYHSALAAMTYTGASLQANKGPQQGVPSSAQATLHSQLQQYQGLQQQQAQQHHQQQQQQQQQQAQNQQQQLIQQYQAMAAAAFASQAGYPGQGQSAAVAAANQLTSQQLSGGLPFAMNPYLAALPQIAAAQRAQLLQQQSAAAGAFQGLGQGLQGAGGGGGFNPFGLQLGGASGLTAANLQQFQQSQQQQQQQQAILAAYGQFARAPVPVVSAAPALTQQLYIGSPVPSAANGSLQGAVGVKRMRPG